MTRRASLGRALLAAATLLCGAALAAPPAAATVAASAPEEAASAPVDWRTAATSALSWGDFDELERLARAARTSGERDVDGLPATAAYMNGLHALWGIGAPEATEAYFANLDAVTAGWLQAHPRSSLAAALHMRALASHAWFQRGGGYANTVAAAQMALFLRTITSALQVAQAARFEPDDVIAHTWLVLVARAAGVDWPTQRALVDAALQRHADDPAIWQELLSSAEPKWGGSWALVDRMVQEAAQRQKTPAEGDMMYARLWAHASGDLEGEFFDSPVDWLRLKRGLRLLVARWPQSAAVNDLAHLACLRRDRAAASEAMAGVGDEPALDHWSWNTERGRSAFDQCQRWLRDPDALPAPAEAPAPRARDGRRDS